MLAAMNCHPSHPTIQEQVCLCESLSLSLSLPSHSTIQEQVCLPACVYARVCVRGCKFANLCVACVRASAVACERE